MKLKHGKKYETADGVVYRVIDMSGDFFDEIDVSPLRWRHWRSDGAGVGKPDLIRRHYKKPKPAHKLDLKPGDVVELVAWEDLYKSNLGNIKTIGVDDVEIPSSYPKGKRPLFRIVSRS